MVTSTSRLFGPHQTTTSPGPNPSWRSPPASRLTSALTSAKEATSSPSITAGLSGFAWAWRAKMSVGAAAMPRTLPSALRFADGPGGVDEADVAEGLGEVAEEL